MPFSKPKSKTKQPDSIEHAYNYTLFLLNLRFYSEGELRQKMRERGYYDDVIEQNVDTLKQEKLIDDGRYAEIYIRNMKDYKTHGFYMVKKKLLERRLSSDLIARYMDEFFTMEDEAKIARRLLKKEVGDRDKSEFDIEQKQKLARKLQARGFRSDIISKLVL